MTKSHSAGAAVSSSGFCAFVSYSHVDSKIARKLHRQLETYRLPIQLRKGSTFAARYRSESRVGKVFRDREDLPAAQDLSLAVKEALQNSQSLIVLCSPNAQSSPWVAREIELFRSLHPDRVIVAAHISGKAEEAFPAPLMTGGQPVIADLRAAGSEWQLGFLKIVAEVASVRLDTLVQCDSQRRVRRVIAVTFGALVALIVATGMTVFALGARNDAKHQQADAERLVEFMLTELRDELKGVGRLDVMNDVNQRALDYYDQPGDLGNMPAESLERRARILRAMGDDDREREQYLSALEKYTKVQRITESLLHKEPNDIVRIFWHSRSENALGLLFGEMKNHQKSLFHYINAKILIDKLIDHADSNEDFLLTKSEIYSNICAHYLIHKLSSEKALKYCIISTRSGEALLEQKPKDENRISMLALNYAWQGDALIANRRIKEGFEFHQHHLRLVEQLVKSNPKNARWQTQKMQSYMGIADLIIKYKDPSFAIKYINESKNIAETLIIRDNKNKSIYSWMNRIKIIEDKIYR